MERRRWLSYWPCGIALFLLIVVAGGCTDPVVTNPPPPAVDPTQPPDNVDPDKVEPSTDPGTVAPATNITEIPPEAKPPRDNGEPAPMADVNPFPRRHDFPEFPADAEWVNSKPLTKADLKGKFVLLDFWTYCCINCMHVLPELKKLEQQYPGQLVVVGVHCAKFEAEKEEGNIRNAVMRYEIEHPVINDPEHEIWNSLGVESWPTIILLDPEGKAVWGKSGEVKAERIAPILDEAIPYYREKGLLKEEPMTFELERAQLAETPLLFPGKVLADETGKRLFITDSNHNRIVVTDLAGKVQSIIGSGKEGRADGPAATASFHLPQGVALTSDGKTLYVADTENHLLRKVDLTKQEVTTISGSGHQGENAWPGSDGFSGFSDESERYVGPPKTTELNSPWALWIHEDALYIAMAGPHQIWKMPLDESEIGPFAGNGREDIVDGGHLPREPYARGTSSFAQPSGLSSDGKVLFVADSEGSSIRAVPFDSSQPVTTVVGSSELPGGRLFAFGDKDGPKEIAKLQHALGVTFVAGQLYITDTYNNKLKMVNAETGETKTLAGDGQRGSDEEPARFNEPAGISHAGGVLYIADTNNHAIRTYDLATGKVGTLAITGMTGNTVDNSAAATTQANPSTATDPNTAANSNPELSKSKEEQLPLKTVKAEGGKVTLHVTLVIPDGWKINPDGPMAYQLASTQGSGPVDRAVFVKHKLETPTKEFDVSLPVQGEGDDVVSVSLRYYFCQDVAESEQGVCKIGNVVFAVPLKVSAAGESAKIDLTHQVEP